MKRYPALFNICLWALVCLAFLSICWDFIRPSSGTIDFQWSGTNLLLSHIDPWSNYLRGDPLHRIQQLQYPNYLPILYVLFLPLGMLTLAVAAHVWQAINIALAMFVGWRTARFYGFETRDSVLITCIVLLATPTRTIVASGQTGLLILAIWCLYLMHRRLKRRHIILSGLSYSKFTFAPPLAIYLLLKRGAKASTLSLIPWLVSLLLVWSWIIPHVSLGVLLTEPLHAAERGYMPHGGHPNLMDVLEVPLRHAGLSATATDAITLLVATGLCCLVLFRAVKLRPDDTPWHLAMMSGLAVVLYKHQLYDSHVLLPGLCFALCNWRSALSKAAVFLILFNWFGERFNFTYFIGSRGWWFFPQFTMLATAMLLLYWQGAGKRSIDIT